MLAIARPLLLNPQLMMLDEPSQGLAPLVVREVLRVVKAMREEGVSVLLVEQNAALSLAVADRAYIIDDGKVVYEGGAAELRQNQALVHRLAGAGSQKHMAGARSQ
jgi:branched-chain amino acid transport system ATP-binding protein